MITSFHRLFCLVLAWPVGVTTAVAAVPSYNFTTFAGSPNLPGSVDGTGAAARFNRPSGLAVDRAGNLYVSESSAIRKITPAGVVTTLVSGLIGLGDPAVDAAGNVYFADLGTEVIKVVTPAGAVSVFTGTAGQTGLVDGVGPAARFYAPTGLAFDAAGNLFVGDLLNTAIRRITPAAVVTTIAGGVGIDLPVDGVGAAARFQQPFHLAVDSAGNIFVADTPSALRKVSPAGVVTTVAGAANQFGHADGRGSDVSFYYIAQIAFDAAGTLFIADAGNYTVRMMTPDGVVTTIAGKVGVYDNVDGVGGNARFTSPSGLAVDGAGNIYVADVNAHVIRKGTPTTAVSPPIITAPLSNNGMVGNYIGAGTSFTLTAQAGGTSPFTMQWIKNGVPIPGATGFTLTFDSATAADAGQYVYTATNAGGTATSATFVVSVYTPTLTSFTSRHAQPGGNFFWGIASGGGQLVVVGTNGAILNSPDGRTWTPRDSGTTDWIVGVTYAAGKFVAVGDHGLILVSADGIAWTRATNSGTTQRLNNVTWGAGTFVAVGEAGTIVSSTDALTWTARTSGVSTWLRGLVYKATAPLPSYSSQSGVSHSLQGDDGSKKFYAAGQNGVLLSSGNGANWSRVTLKDSEAPVTKDIEALVDGPIGVGDDGLIVDQYVGYFRYGSYSKALGPDGRLVAAIFDVASYSWLVAHVGLKARFRGLALGAGAIFATGENGTIAASANFIGPWALIPSGTTANLVGGVFHGNSLFIVGENETILQSDPLYTSRLVDIATRGNVGTGAATMISGFVVSGTAPKQVLLRAAGPALAGFGLNGTLAAPILTLFDSTGRPLATNTRWNTAANATAIAAAATRVGAFPFAAGSADSALLVTLDPGAYTAQVVGAGGTGGLALVEAYDAEPLANEGSRAINLSTRGQVGAGDSQLIAGFVLSGAASRRVLIRAVGPTLASFGVPGIVAEPQLRLFDQSGTLLQTAAAWSLSGEPDGVRAAASIAGAFALDEGSKDAAIVTTLLPGAYTVQVSGLNNTSGLAIVEVYDLP